MGEYLSSGFVTRQGSNKSAHLQKQATKPAHNIFISRQGSVIITAFHGKILFCANLIIIQTLLLYTWVVVSNGKNTSGLKIHVQHV